jgi:hypothetical protein
VGWDSQACDKENGILFRLELGKSKVTAATTIIRLIQISLALLVRGTNEILLRLAASSPSKAALGLSGRAGYLPTYMAERGKKGWMQQASER